MVGVLDKRAGVISTLWHHGCNADGLKRIPVLEGGYFMSKSEIPGMNCDMTEHLAGVAGLPDGIASCVLLNVSGNPEYDGFWIVECKRTEELEKEAGKHQRELHMGWFALALSGCRGSSGDSGTAVSRFSSDEIETAWCQLGPCRAGASQGPCARRVGSALGRRPSCRKQLTPAMRTRVRPDCPLVMPCSLPLAQRSAKPPGFSTICRRARSFPVLERRFSDRPVLAA